MSGPTGNPLRVNEGAEQPITLQTRPKKFKKVFRAWKDLFHPAPVTPDRPPNSA